jgi:hypothetical protein
VSVALPKPAALTQPLLVRIGNKDWIKDWVRIGNIFFFESLYQQRVCDGVLSVAVARKHEATTFYRTGNPLDPCFLSLMTSSLSPSLSVIKNTLCITNFILLRSNRQNIVRLRSRLRKQALQMPHRPCQSTRPTLWKWLPGWKEWKHRRQNLRTLMLCLEILTRDGLHPDSPLLPYQFLQSPLRAHRKESLFRSPILSIIYFLFFLFSFFSTPPKRGIGLTWTAQVVVRRSSTATHASNCVHQTLPRTCIKLFLGRK